MKPKILLVDDEVGPREMLKMVLNDMYDVTTASSVNQALQLYKQTQPSIIITDLRMPGKDGIQLAKEIRAYDQVVEIILFTGYGDVQQARDSMQVGINDFIQKPASVDTIKNVVSRSLIAVAKRQQDLKPSTPEAVENSVVANNPATDLLTGLDTLTYLSQTLNANKEQIQQQLETIKQNAVRCVNLLQYWQRLVKELPIEYRTFDLVGLIHEVCASLPKKLGISYQLPNAPVMVYADRFQIRRLLFNVLDNAVKAIVGQGTIQVRTRSGETHVTIEVQDSGVGIPISKQPSIFSAITKPDGIELGLFIAKNIVEAHNGYISFVTAYNVGTVFTIRLPLTNNISITD